MSTSNAFEQRLKSPELPNSESSTEPKFNPNRQNLEISQRLEELALFVAQAWQDYHSTAHPDSLTDFQACTLYVTTEMAIAATSVGGPIGLEILVGGGSAAACVACRRVLSTTSNEGLKAGNH